jgi:hypothetical protein
LETTNSIRGGANREVLKPIAEGGAIYDAYADEAWTVDGAAVRVSLVCFTGVSQLHSRLNGAEVGAILADLTAAQYGTDLTKAIPLIQNRNIAFQGTISYGPFEMPGTAARAMLTAPVNPNGRKNKEVVRPWTNGKDVATRGQDRWIVFFPGQSTEEEASLFEQPFAHVAKEVVPYRKQRDNADLNRFWWRLWRSRPELFRALTGLARMIVTPRVSKHRLFVWRDVSVVPDSAVVAIARDDDTTFGLLHSRYHELWSLRMGTWLGVGNDPRYTPTTTFETFPFPLGLTPNILAGDYSEDTRAIAIAGASKRLNELRENWLNPADLVRREPEVVAGYPDRIIPVSNEAALALKKRTLTNLYNERPTWLQHAHKALDEAVAAAYGWPADLPDDEVLARLFALNQERAAGQAASGAG